MWLHQRTGEVSLQEMKAKTRIGKTLLNEIKIGQLKCFIHIKHHN